jgi:hypothetical protein
MSTEQGREPSEAILALKPKVEPKKKVVKVVKVKVGSKIIKKPKK